MRRFGALALLAVVAQAEFEWEIGVARKGTDWAKLKAVFASTSVAATERWADAASASGGTGRSRGRW